MLAKGNDLIKGMAESGCVIGPLTWDALVKLYIDVGEVEKADSILQKAAKKKRDKPMFSSYMAVMDQYAKRGDIDNADKMFVTYNHIAQNPSNTNPKNMFSSCSFFPYIGSSSHH
ncbi:unnamed protein product [Fraxinus pennsylvanica]|uniref:Pentatricopeptide repeat-containing protein n=1 Tax=Fraxinus pennsylvanica TaxID=56036 RepID=A0AAD1Z5A6_9LAMI|nr:unnamed protein product [Fraxinus pennsylvanica]